MPPGGGPKVSPGTEPFLHLAFQREGGGGSAIVRERRSLQSPGETPAVARNLPGRWAGGARSGESAALKAARAGDHGVFVPLGRVGGSCPLPRGPIRTSPAPPPKGSVQRETLGNRSRHPGRTRDAGGPTDRGEVGRGPGHAPPEVPEASRNADELVEEVVAMPVESMFPQALAMVAHQEVRGVLKVSMPGPGAEECGQGRIQPSQGRPVRPLDRGPGVPPNEVRHVLTETQGRKVTPIGPGAPLLSEVRFVGLQQAYEQEKGPSGPASERPAQGSDHGGAMVEPLRRAEHSCAQPPEGLGPQAEEESNRRTVVTREGLEEMPFQPAGPPGPKDGLAVAERRSRIESVEVPPRPHGRLDQIVGGEGQALPTGFPPCRGEGMGCRPRGPQDIARIGRMGTGEKGQMGGKRSARAGHEVRHLPGAGELGGEEGHVHGEGEPRHLVGVAEGVRHEDHEVPRPGGSTPPRPRRPMNGSVRARGARLYPRCRRDRGGPGGVRPEWLL